MRASFTTWNNAVHLFIGLVCLLDLMVLVAWPTIHETELGHDLSSLYKMSCHGLPGRCYQFRGSSMPVCARCVGISLGLLIGALGGLIGRALCGWRIASVLVGLMLAEWTAGVLGIVPRTWHIVRTITGTLAAAGAYTLLRLTVTKMVRWFACHGRRFPALLPAGGPPNGKE